MTLLLKSAIIMIDIWIGDFLLIPYRDMVVLI